MINNLYREGLNKSYLWYEYSNIFRSQYDKIKIVCEFAMINIENSRR